MRKLNTILDPIGFIMKTPRTKAELVDLHDTTMGTVHQWVKRLQAHGLIYVCEWRGAAPLYAWQPSPFCHDDVPRPRRPKPVPKRRWTPIPGAGE